MSKKAKTEKTWS